MKGVIELFRHLRAAHDQAAEVLAPLNDFPRHEPSTRKLLKL